MNKVLSLMVVGSFTGCVGMEPLAGEAEHESKGKPSGALDPGAPSLRGITPSVFSGNFVAVDDDQICYEIFGSTATEEMRGFKVDPPTNFENAAVKVTVQPNGQYLDWESKEGYEVLAFVVKGADAYNLYDYLGTGFTWDKDLHSPVKNNKLPAISHYNACYQPTEPPEGDQGCTPGYWRNHFDRWLGASTSDDFDATFGVDAFAPDITLGQAAWLGGGGVNALARHATAALLNSFGGVPNADGTTVAYPYSTAEVLAMVQAAFDGDDTTGTVESIKDLFAAANELGCPLGGTPAT
jgi:hypothetical protein